MPTDYYHVLRQGPLSSLITEMLRSYEGCTDWNGPGSSAADEGPHGAPGWVPAREAADFTIDFFEASHLPMVVFKAQVLCSFVLWDTGR